MSANAIIFFEGWEYLAGIVVVLLAVLIVSSRDASLTRRPYDRIHGDCPGASSERAVETTIASLSRGTR